MSDITSTPKYEYRRRLPHFQKSDKPLFITCCIAGPLILPAEARDLVLGHCLRERSARVDLFAVVVMPDHAHLLLKALRDENGWPFPLIEIMQSLKSSTAHRIKKLLRRSGPVWRKNPSITCCGPTKASSRSVSAYGRIR